MTGHPAASRRLPDLIEAAVVFWFFYQALRVLFSMLFGQLYDALFAGSGSLLGVGLYLALVVLAFLAPLAAPGRPRPARAARLVAAVVVFLARISLTFDEPQGRLVASILIVAAAGVYLALLLRSRPGFAAPALGLGLLVDLLLRTAGQSLDPTLRPGWWPVQAALSVGLCFLSGWLFFRERDGQPADGGLRAGLLAAPVWGGWLFLETSLLVFPQAAAHLTAANPSLEAIRSFAVGTAVALTLFSLPGSSSSTRRRDWILLGALAMLGLVWAYAWPQVLGGLPIILAQAALLVLGRVFSVSDPERPGRVGAALALGGVLYLVLSFLWAFTFTYPYVVELFRGLGWLVFIVAGLLATVPAVFTRPAPKPVARPASEQWIVALAVMVFLSVLAYKLVAPVVVPAVEPSQTLRVATYNIHYGYDSDWRFRLEAQAQAIETAGADVVALQEVDTGRTTSYMVDDLRWLAGRLNMDFVFLPTLEHQSGIGLLSRFPIVESDTLLLPSELEQTGIIWANLDVGGRPLNAFAVWMGLKPDERARQLDAALPFVAGHPGPAVWGGDFNSTPDSPVYARISGAGLIDPFAALGLGSPPTDPAVNPDKRIDFVWLRGLRPVSASVAPALASDHRLVVVEVEMP